MLKQCERTCTEESAFCMQIFPVHIALLHSERPKLYAERPKLSVIELKKITGSHGHLLTAGEQVCDEPCLNGHGNPEK